MAIKRTDGPHDALTRLAEVGLGAINEAAHGSVRAVVLIFDRDDTGGAGAIGYNAEPEEFAQQVIVDLMSQAHTFAKSFDLTLAYQLTSADGRRWESRES